MSGMEIRPAGPADAEAIGSVHARSRAVAYDGLVPRHALAQVTPDSQADYWRERLAVEPDPHAVYVVVVDGIVAGFALGSAVGRTATLNALHVLPALHGSGAGHALHDRLLGDFAAWGCTTAELWVLEGNERAQAFYRRHGWSHDGTRDAHAVGGVDVPILRYRRPVTSATTRR
jgi:ribosomal protein S18 acetylase RimI-like enzyme